MDLPPPRCFDEPATEGPVAGVALNRERYDGLLQSYYDRHGWDERGIPRRSTLEDLGLTAEPAELAEESLHHP